jgi:hypothetical protein
MPRKKVENSRNATKEGSVLGTVRRQLRPDVIAAMVDFGRFVILWTGVFGAHLTKVIAAVSGIDPEFIQVVSFMERWVWVASFAAFFWRVLVKLWRQVQSGD